MKWLTVGKVKDAHGLRGELKILIFSGELAWSKGLTEVCLFKADSIATAKEPDVVLSVGQIRSNSKGFILKSKELENRTEAEKYIGYLVRIPEEYFVAPKGEDIFLNEIDGFSVAVRNQGVVGKIVGFLESPAHSLAVVKTEKGEFEVPLVPEFIVNIDFDSKLIEMDLPLGLLGEEFNE